MKTLYQFLFGGVRFDSWLTDVLIALPRVAFGLILPLKFGLSKFPTPEWFIEDVGKLGFPMPWFFAWAAVLTEVVGSFLLAAGLFTRPMAMLVIITMGVAAFVQKGPSPMWEKLPSLCFMVNAWFALLLGSGRLGLDELLRRRFD